MPATVRGIEHPELPRAEPSYPPDLHTRACTDRPRTSRALQSALEAGGTRVICLAAGTEYRGNFNVPARSPRDSGWTVLRGDVPLSLGERLTGPEALPVLIVDKVNQPGLWFHERSARWLVQGIEVTTDSALTQGPMALVFVGEFIGERTEADLPRDIHFVHVSVRGWIHQNVRRGFVLNGANHIVRDSRCVEIHERNSDSQCVLSYNGPGPFLIENNLLEAASENIMFGGGDPGIPGLVPCDITIRGNTIRKPVTWQAIGKPTQSGSYLIKLLIEAKNACRVLVEQNRLDGSWLDGQTGYAIGLKSVNQDGSCRWCRVTDWTIRQNTIVRVGAGFGLAGRPERHPVDSALSRILVYGNWIDSLNVAPHGGDQRGILLGWQAKDIQFVRNVWAGGNYGREFAILSLDTRPAVTGFRFDDNVAPIGVYGVGATAAGEGSRALTAAVSGTLSFARNTFIGASRPNYPATTRWAASLGAALATGAGIRARPVP